MALADNGDLDCSFWNSSCCNGKKRMSGTSNDLDGAAESGAVTMAGSPGADEYVFFQVVE